jgi:hypothetical protein
MPKSREFSFRAPFPQLLGGEKISYLDQIFKGPLFFPRLELDDFRTLGAESLRFYGWSGQEFPEFQTSCEELRPEESDLSKVSLLNQVKVFPLFLGEIEVGCPPARGFPSPVSHSHSRRLREGKGGDEDKEETGNEYGYSHFHHSSE